MLHLLTFFVSFLSVISLSPFLKHYEPLNYHSSDLTRVSRSAQPHDSVTLELAAFNRTFKLRLRKISPHESVFLEDAIVEFGNETMKVERGAHVYKGYVEGEEGSRVYGTIFDGIFTGSIELVNGKEYGIDYSSLHDSSAPFHTFIYDVDDIKMPKTKKIVKRSDGSSSTTHESESMCGLSDPNIAESLKVEKDTLDSSSFIPPFPQRSTRAASAPSRKVGEFYDYRLCNLYMQIDHLLYNHYLNGPGNKDEKKTYQLLSQLMEKEISGVNRVYKATDFKGIKDIEFGLANLTIFKTKDEKGNKYSDESLDVNSFLAVSSMLDHRKYCLAYTMTYRDFAGGTLGLAYVGGVCSTYREHAATQANTNAGIVTYLNHGQTVLDRISYLTLAHEIGHNFGSPHDETDECKGEGSAGQFIMWYSATSGDQPNNKKFSTCSIDKMSSKLHEVMKIDPANPEGGQRNCFIQTGSPVCGNGIVEKGDDLQNPIEECDCGGAEGCKLRGDTCCEPTTCKRKIQNGSPVQCSPSEGPCCSDNCEYTPETKNFECSQATDCAKASTCKGDKAECPKAVADREGEPCMDVTGICSDTICNTTMVCSKTGLEDCESEEKTCMRHCKKDGVCTSTSTLEEFKKDIYKQSGRWGHPGVLLGQMSQCMGGKGTCNQFDICKKVQASGSLSRNMGKIVAGFQSFGDLMMKKIWVLILIVIGVVALLVVVIKFCSYATPSSNPNKPKAKSIKQIKNMMSDRVKRISSKRKPKKGKAPSAATTPATAQTPKEKTNEEEE